MVKTKAKRKYNLKPKFRSERGTLRQVWTGRVLRTKAGLTKKYFKLNVRGRIVSKKRSENAKQHQQMKLWREAENEVKELHNKTTLISEKRKGTKFYEEIRKRYENKLFQLDLN